MSKIKKILAVLVTLAMVMAMSVTAFAASNLDGIVGTVDDRGDIVVGGIDVESPMPTVTAYPIAMATYDSNKNFSGYTNPYNIVDLENPTQAELSDIAAGKKGSLPTGTVLTYNETEAIYKGNDMAVGMYLICVTGAETKVYNVAVASINYKNSSGNNVIDGGSVTMVESGSAWVKKSTTPSVSKVIVEGDTKVKGNSVNIGDDVSYEVTVGPVPNYGGNYPKLEVVDTLSDGLKYNSDLVIKVGNNTLVEGTDYDVKVDGQKIKVNFVVGGAYTLNNYVGQNLVFTYTAELTGNDVNINEVFNNNDVVLTYTKDSKTSGNDASQEDKTYTYTFEIDGEATKDIITKYGEEDKDEDGSNDPLEGAVFKLYLDKNCADSSLYTNDVFNGSVTSDVDGQLNIKGLEAGTYYLKEVSAPTGYSVNTHVFTIVISATYSDNGQLNTWKVTIDETDVATFKVNNDGKFEAAISGIDIQNTKLNALPSTGGIGTTIFTVGGCLIMIAAAALFFVSRRKASNK